MLGIGKLEIYGILFIILGITMAGAYFKGHSNGIKKERNEWLLKQQTATKADLQELQNVIVEGNNIAREVADKLGKQKARQIIDRGVIEREIKTDIRYSADCFPATGLLQWNAISTGRGILPSSETPGTPTLILPGSSNQPNK